METYKIIKRGFTCFKSSSFFKRWNCLCFAMNADFTSSSLLGKRGGSLTEVGVWTRVGEGTGKFDGVLGLTGGVLRNGVLGRLLGSDLRCALAGVVGRLAMRGVWGLLSCKLFGVWGRLDITGVMGRLGTGASGKYGNIHLIGEVEGV